MIKLIIPGEPVSKQRGRTFIHNATGRSTTLTPQKTVNYEVLIKEIYASSGQEMLEGELSAHIQAYFGITKSTSKKKAEEMRMLRIRPVKKPDTDNLAKICLDALNGIGFKDDSQIVHLEVDKYYSDVPRVEISICNL